MVCTLSCVLPRCALPCPMYTSLPCPTVPVGAVHTDGPVVYTARVVLRAVLALYPLQGLLLLVE